MAWPDPAVQGDPPGGGQSERVKPAPRRGRTGHRPPVDDEPGARWFPQRRDDLFFLLEFSAACKTSGLYLDPTTVAHGQHAVGCL